VQFFRPFRLQLGSVSFLVDTLKKADPPRQITALLEAAAVPETLF
jgi:hypothetical protein